MATKEEIASVVGHKPLTFEQMKEIEALQYLRDKYGMVNMTGN